MAWLCKFHGVKRDYLSSYNHFFMQHFKVVLVGTTRVGKTSIIQKYVNNQFTINTNVSTQSAFFQKQINCNGTDIVLDVWDTAGQERFHSLAPMYYRDAKSIIVVYDITDATSFARAKQWVVEMDEERDKSESFITLVGNKYDLRAIRVVNPQDVSDYSRKVGLINVETSAKTGFGINELFMDIGLKLIQNFRRSNSNQDFSITETYETDKKCC